MAQGGPADGAGWHPSLTLDMPILPPAAGAQLDTARRPVLTLGRFLSRLFLGGSTPTKSRPSFGPSCSASRTGRPAADARQFAPAREHLRPFESAFDIDASSRPIPYVRRVQEPWSMLWTIRGAGRNAFSELLRQGRRQIGRRMACRATIGWPASPIRRVGPTGILRKLAAAHSWTGRRAVVPSGACRYDADRPGLHADRRHAAATHQ